MVNVQEQSDFNQIYPECWTDDVRMNSLFAPFRLKSINPENYDAKLKFWKEMIVKYCTHKGAADFNLREVQLAFKRKSNLPCCLQTVMDELIATKQIRLKTLFLNDPLDGWYSWAVDSLVKKPIGWGFQKFKQAVISSETQPQPNYIHLDVIHQQSEDLNNELQKFAGKVMPLNSVIKSVWNLNLNHDGIKTSLHYLHYQKKIFLEYINQDGQQAIHLVKIPDKNCAPSPVTDMERSILQLEEIETSLIKVIDGIETEAKQNEDMARTYLKEGKRSMAKGCLKKKHILENKIEKKSGSLENIQNLITRLQDSQSDETVIGAYKLGSKALKTALSESGVNINNVDEIMSNIKESIEIHDELQQTIATNPVSDNIDDSSLEEELADLLLDEADNKNNNRPIQLQQENKVESIDDILLKKLEGLEILNTTLSHSEDDNIRKAQAE